MAQKFANAARAALAANITDVSTTITITAGGALFPVANGTDWFKAVLQDSNGIEIVKVVGHTAASNTFTVERGQEGTVARAFVANSVFGQRVTAGDMELAVEPSMVGPASATDGGIAVFDGTTGKALTNSGIELSAAGYLRHIKTLGDVGELNKSGGTSLNYGHKFGYVQPGYINYQYKVVGAVANDATVSEQELYEGGYYSYAQVRQDSPYITANMNTSLDTSVVMTQWYRSTLTNSEQRSAWVLVNATNAEYAVGRSNGAFKATFGLNATQTWLMNNSGNPLDFYSGTISTPSNLAMRIALNRDVSIGNAVMATNATAGFFSLPSMPGAPTGAVTEAYAGAAALAVDSTENKVYVNIGGTWRDTLASVWTKTLAGFSTASGAVVTAADTLVSALGKLQKQVSDNLTTLTNHTSNTSNPHGVTKAQVGLGNVDNTSDVNKPVSTAQAASDDLRVLKSGDTMTGNLAVPSLNGGQLAGLRNKIINGNFDIWQRGTAFTTGAIYTADRWKAAGATGQTVNRVADHPLQGANGFCAEVVHTSGAQWISQYVEALNSRDLVGKTVTVTAWVLRTSGSANQNLQLLYANTADNFSATTSIASSGGVAATVWTQLTLTTTIPAGGANGLEVRVVTGGSAATVRVAQVQLEVGSVATPFEHRPFGMELSLCQRYYYRVTATSANQRIVGGYATGTTTAQFVVPFPVTMRIAPTALEQSGTAAHHKIFYGAGSVVSLSAVPVYGTSLNTGGLITCTVAAGLTLGQGVILATDSADAYLGWSAEL